jgi:hypothetical protein
MSSSDDKRPRSMIESKRLEMRVGRMDDEKKVKGGRGMTACHRLFMQKSGITTGP